MKKRILSLLLAMALLVSLSGVFGLSAQAASMELIATVNSFASWVLYQGGPDCVLTITESNGSYPAGMSVFQEGDRLLLEGTPEASGIYFYTITVSEKCESYVTEDNPDGIKEDTVKTKITVQAEEVRFSTYADEFEEGESVSVSIAHSDVQFKEANIDEGKVPDGLKVTCDETTFFIKGTPTKPGTYDFVIHAFDYQGDAHCYQPVKLIITETEKAKVPKVTKDPTGETVKEGESAIFIAKADNAKTITWYLVSANDKTKIEIKNAPNQFTGLTVTGHNAEKLVLSNIPMELNGWKVQAKFTGEGGDEVWGKTAAITVTKAELKLPAITTQPRGTELDADQTTVLKVSAVSPDGNTLVYQWYMNDTESNSGGKAIPGATSASYTPEYIEGTVYYYCTVRNSTGTDISAAVKTDAVAVTYRAEEAEETTEPETTEEVTEEETEEETIRFDDPEETEPSKPAKSRSILPVILAIIVCVAVIVTCTVLLVLRYLPRKEEEAEELNPEDFDEVPDDEQ